LTQIKEQNQVKVRRRVRYYSISCAQSTCIIEYKWKTKDRKFLKLVPFINNFGGKAVKITGYVYFVIGSLLMYISMFYYESFLYITNEFLYIIIILLICITFIILIEAGMSLPSLVEYVRSTKCKNCSREYAYEEIEEPDVKEVSTQNSYIVTITRHWKCKYCGFIDSSESPENVKTCKGEKKEPKQIECENCGLTKIRPEYKNPDIKKEELPSKTITTAIRYYKCGYCGRINIEVEKKTVRGRNPSGISKSTGDDPRL
jgi:rubredoxin